MLKYILLISTGISGLFSVLFFFSNTILFGIFLASASISIVGYVLAFLLEENNKLLEIIKKVLLKEQNDRLNKNYNEERGKLSSLFGEPNDTKGPWKNKN